jgi:hypothetical protein
LREGTKKFADYELFNKAFNIIKEKHHLTEEDLKKIVAIKLVTNLGRLSPRLEEAYPNLTPAERPLVQNKKNL